MSLARTTAVIAIATLVSCSLTRPIASRASRHPPPHATPVPVSPVDLRTAILTLPASAVAEMSEQGRRVYLANTPGDFDEVHRRLDLFCDSPAGGDATSMLYLRLFEDTEGNTIAASHAARPFADGTTPSPQFTRVHRLVGGIWTDITDEALPHGILRKGFFEFNQPGPRISFGYYVQEKREDGRGNRYNFGKTIGTIEWRNGAFHENTKG